MVTLACAAVADEAFKPSGSGSGMDEGGCTHWLLCCCAWPGIGGGNAALASMKTDGNGKAIASSKVVFVRVGGQYFLHEVWAAGSADHLVALQTKAEKQAQKLEAANRANAPAVEIALAK